MIISRQVRVPRSDGRRWSCAQHSQLVGWRMDSEWIIKLKLAMCVLKGFKTQLLANQKTAFTQAAVQYNIPIHVRGFPAMIWRGVKPFCCQRQSEVGTSVKCRARLLLRKCCRVQIKLQRLQHPLCGRICYKLTVTSCFCQN